MGDKLNNKSIFSEEATEEALSKMDRLSSVFTLNGIMKYVSGEPQQALYSLSINPKSDAVKVDRKYIDMVLSKDNDDFDPTFIFRDLGMGKTLKKKRINKHYDIVVLNKGDYPGIKERTETTLGRLLINKVIWSHARLDYINVEFTGKIIKTIFLKLRDYIMDNKLEMREFKRTLQIFEDFGFRMGSFINPSVDSDILKTNPLLEKKKEELFTKYAKELAANDVETAVKIENELIDYAKQVFKDQDYLEWYKSGASSKMGYGNDFKVSQLMLGTIPKGLGSGEFHVSTSNFMQGIKKDELHVVADQMVVALHAKVQNTAVSGYMAKQGAGIFQTVKLDKLGTDCKTKRGVDIAISPSNYQDYIGNYLVDGTYLDETALKKLIGKVVKVRNVFTCDSEIYCSKCAGELSYKLENTDKQIPIGLEIHNILTELTQASLQKTHQMAVQLDEVGDINNYFE